VGESPSSCQPPPMDVSPLRYLPIHNRHPRSSCWPSSADRIACVQQVTSATHKLRREAKSRRKRCRRGSQPERRAGPAEIQPRSRRWTQAGWLVRCCPGSVTRATRASGSDQQGDQVAGRAWPRGLPESGPFRALRAATGAAASLESSRSGRGAPAATAARPSAGRAPKQAPCFQPAAGCAGAGQTGPENAAKACHCPGWAAAAAGAHCHRGVQGSACSAATQVDARIDTAR
jgi:hypothetical protein